MFSEHPEPTWGTSEDNALNIVCVAASATFYDSEILRGVFCFFQFVFFLLFSNCFRIVFKDILNIFKRFFVIDIDILSIDFNVSLKTTEVLSTVIKRGIVFKAINLMILQVVLGL